MKLVNLIEAGLEVGDQVWNHMRQCWGRVEYINTDERINYSIKVKVEYTHGHSLTEYTKDGLRHHGDKSPTIFLDKIQFEVPTKKPEPDYAKEFTTDTPWMVRDEVGEDWNFCYAAAYCAKSNEPFYIFANKCMGKDSTFLTSRKYARKLTAAERSKYLGEQE